MGTLRLALHAALAVGLAAACSPGSLWEGDGGCTGPGCADADGCTGPGCADADDGPFDPCDTIECPAGQVCVEGRCRTEDPCEGVVCDNPGEVCDPRYGACRPGGSDEDGDGYTIAAGDCDDGDPTVHPGAAETCDGRDEDCDLEVDEGFPDADGDGFDTCGFGRPEQADCDDDDAMRRPGATERCDGVDNDCDEAVDEGILARSCETACGVGEERCEGGEWVCSVPETCECTPAGDVEDEECGLCGARSRTCGTDLRWGTWSACADEGECAALSTGGCTTSCGSTGTRSCDALCAWGPCAPPAETCNGADDDCDGAVDEGFRVETLATTYTVLRTHHSTCDGSAHRSDIYCASAIHRFCASRACSMTGFGPTENSGDTAHVACLAGASVVSTTWTELASHHPGCDGASENYGPACFAASHRLCTSRGFASGYGAVEASGGTAYVVCVSAADVVNATYTTLVTHHPGCDGSTERWGPACNAAINRFCASTGRTTGFGPVENSGDAAWVACVFP